MKQPLYVTPRMLLIQYLDDGNHPDIFEWIVKGYYFKSLSWSNFEDEWIELTRQNKKDQEEYDVQIACDFLSSLMSGMLMPDVNSTKCQLLTKSHEKRRVVSDLVPGPLYEWIIRLLLERTRTDWVDWSSKEQLEFKINTRVGLKKMSDAYVKVNEIKTNNSLYYTKLMLSSLCTTGILIKTPKRKYAYKFNREWYEKEIQREVDGEDDPSKYTRIGEQIILSWIEYPKQTLNDILPCCGANHADDAAYF